MKLQWTEPSGVSQSWVTFTLELWPSGQLPGGRWLETAVQILSHNVFNRQSLESSAISCPLNAPNFWYYQTPENYLQVFFWIVDAHVYNATFIYLSSNTHTLYYITSGQSVLCTSYSGFLTLVIDNDKDSIWFAIQNSCFVYWTFCFLLFEFVV